jgi:hypothetical protein
VDRLNQPSLLQSPQPGFFPHESCASIFLKILGMGGFGLDTLTSFLHDGEPVFFFLFSLFCMRLNGSHPLGQEAA